MITLSDWNRLNRQQRKKKVLDCGDIDRSLVAENMVIFDAFVKEAHRVVGAGRTHYSARTIIEVIRHHTLLKDKDKTFKINNDLTPKLAKISMLLFPKLNGLFELRQ